MPDGRKSATLAIHAGSRLESRAHPLAPDIHISSVSYFDSAEALDRSLDGQDFVYTRISGQNAALLEEAVGALEGAGGCVAYASGMAALRAVLESQHLKSGDVLVVAADGYGTTRALCKAHCAARGAVLHSVDLSQPAGVQQLAALRPKLVLAESVTNPLLSVTDLSSLAEACKAVGAALIVDATFVSPALQRPLDLGADYSLHSTTKWINGHSDAMGGVVSASAEKIAPLKAARVVEGAILGPFEAYLTLRGLRTLLVRMRAHSQNALRVAERLSASPLVGRVLYPGSPAHPHHEVARRMLSGGFGGMVSFEIRGASRPQAFKFLESVRLAAPAPSLGDVGTMVMHAASAASRRLTPQERAAAGIHENLIRVSVGLEDPDDIADDLIAAATRAME